ncbi:hypothetical protein AB0I66_41985 [Streptomyces sp. NPDC050439]
MEARTSGRRDLDVYTVIQRLHKMIAAGGTCPLPLSLVHLPTASPGIG